jgi:hypothetical protein
MLAISDFVTINPPTASPTPSLQGTSTDPLRALGEAIPHPTQNARLAWLLLCPFRSILTSPLLASEAREFICS